MTSQLPVFVIGSPRSVLDYVLRCEKCSAYLEEEKAM